MPGLDGCFHEEMINIRRKAKTECDHNAIRFLPMVASRGGLRAAKARVHASGLSEGLAALWGRGRLGLTMEGLVLRAPSSDLSRTRSLASLERG